MTRSEPLAAVDTAAVEREAAEFFRRFWQNYRRDLKRQGTRDPDRNLKHGEPIASNRELAGLLQRSEGTIRRWIDEPMWLFGPAPWPRADIWEIIGWSDKRAQNSAAPLGLLPCPAPPEPAPDLWTAEDVRGFLLEQRCPDLDVMTQRDFERAALWTNTAFAAWIANRLGCGPDDPYPHTLQPAMKLAGIKRPEAEVALATFASFSMNLWATFAAADAADPAGRGPTRKRRRR